MVFDYGKFNYLLAMDQPITKPMGSYLLQIHSHTAIIIGSGAAALNAALQIHQQATPDLILLTRKSRGGVSYNSGSDKQTYYKVACYGDQPDSPVEMAQTLFQGGSMHGELALIEASLSLPAFFNLTNLGVPFPQDAYGGFVGYKTDHDPRQRGTSAGPLTSQYMVKHLWQAVHQREIPYRDQTTIFKLFSFPTGFLGALAMEWASRVDDVPIFHLYVAPFLVLATGGGGGIYASSVYPPHHLTSIGLALELGAEARNLTEWQYGIASINPRWNLSGSYQQVLPRYYSVDTQGKDKRFFLEDAYNSLGMMATHVFLKGYQWPFDVRKVQGSSMVDLLIYRETVLRNRSVFIDFRENPGSSESSTPFEFNKLSEEAFSYLQASDILFGTPYERLQQLNPAAIDLYKSKGIDLESTPLEVAICAQHINGGLSVDSNWQTTIPGLYAVGEIAGTHGVYRPGGSALNSGQVGGFRIAAHLAEQLNQKPDLLESFHQQVEELRFDSVSAFFDSIPNFHCLDDEYDAPFRTYRRTLQDAFSMYAGIIRDPKNLEHIQTQLHSYRLELEALGRNQSSQSLSLNDWQHYIWDRHLFITMEAHLVAWLNYAAEGGTARGSALWGTAESLAYPDKLTLSIQQEVETLFRSNNIQTIRWTGTKWETKWEDVHPIPATDAWFETIWNEQQNKRRIY
jgi:succinate dehydrogenase/fumarate reductase flavoprotein subunit